MTLITLIYRRHGLKIAAALTAAVTVASATGALAARADQLSTDQQYASYLAGRIATLGQRESALGEQYDAGMAALTAANGRVASASANLAAAEAAQRNTIGLLQQDAVEAYVGGGPQMALSGNVPATSPSGSLLRQELAETFASEQSDALDNYRLAADNATVARQQLVAARNVDARQLASLEKDRQAVQDAQDQLVATEQQVKGRIAVLVEQIEQQKLAEEQAAEQQALIAEQEAQAAAAAKQAEEQAQAQRAQAEEEAAQQAAAAREAAAATTTTTSPPSSQSAEYVPPSVPGASSAAATAVAAAESRVGDPYVWGAAGPDAFDCSGLVMWAYDQAGVYLPHYSGAQFADTTQIPMSDLEPGDLVFPADPGQHVAMYVGNGDIVQAPYTGADVQIVPLTSFFVLATRVG
ncbi:MAG TPA: NlpC/P60 family protein [Acidimicrobiales bacterium]|nr:NlpC/P60 family protein [Acidimicrobiales bacterium]